MPAIQYSIPATSETKPYAPPAPTQEIATASEPRFAEQRYAIPASLSASTEKHYAPLGGPRFNPPTESGSNMFGSAYGAESAFYMDSTDKSQGSSGLVYTPTTAHAAAADKPSVDASVPVAAQSAEMTLAGDEAPMYTPYAVHDNGARVANEVNGKQQATDSNKLYVPSSTGSTDNAQASAYGSSEVQGNADEVAWGPDVLSSWPTLGDAQWQKGKTFAVSLCMCAC